MCATKRLKKGDHISTSYGMIISAPVCEHVIMLYCRPSSREDESRSKEERTEGEVLL